VKMMTIEEIDAAVADELFRLLHLKHALTMLHLEARMFLDLLLVYSSEQSRLYSGISTKIYLSTV